MGIFSGLKNRLTGGWAQVSLTAPPARRGDSLDVTVHVAVQDQPIAIQRVYLKLHCAEHVDIPGYPAQWPPAIGQADPPKTLHIQHEVILDDQDVTLAAAQTLEAGTTQTFEGKVRIPAHLPPTFQGQASSIQWRALAGLEMAGNDPDSGWVPITVE